MTDFQFKAYLELRDKYEALLREMDNVNQTNTRNTEDGMTDFQFRRYEKLRDKCDEMSHELAMLREENIRLQIQAEMLKTLNEKKQYRTAQHSND